MSSRIGARSWLAQAQVDHARLLLDRDRAGDRDDARRLVELAARAQADIGLASIAPALEALTGRLGRPTVDVPDPSHCGPVFRRAGAVWDLDFGGRRVQIPHGRGLRDVAHPLARPDQAVSVLELVDEPASATGAMTLAASTAKDEHKIRDAFRAGTGLGWHEHHHDLFHGTERLFKPGYVANLVTEWIPQVERLGERLREGA